MNKNIVVNSTLTTISYEVYMVMVVGKVAEWFGSPFDMAMVVCSNFTMPTSLCFW